MINSVQCYDCQHVAFDNAKKSFYRAFNGVFGKVGRVASENVVVELLKVKCCPMLYYGLESVPITRNQIHALEFVLNGCFRKIFRTGCNDIVHECMSMFNVLSPDSAIAKRKM